MKRDNDFEMSRIAKASTSKVVVETHMDSFNIEKVSIRAVEYATGKMVQAYLDFDDFLLISQDVKSGRMFKELASAGQNKTLSMGGTANSKNYNGMPESRIIALGMSGEKVFLTLSMGRGKLNQTGLIQPDGQPDLKLTVAMTVDDCRKFFITTEAFVNAYLVTLVSKQMKQIAQKREEYNRNRG